MTDLRFHWYWPFARAEELEWARATVRPGEQIVVQVLDRDAAPPAQTSSSLIVRRDLPDVDRTVRGWRWPVSRTWTYRTRSSVRRRLWAEERFDLVHLHYVNRFTDVTARFPHPLVMSVHDVVPHVSRLGSAEHFLLRRLYRRADALVVHHDRLGERLIAEFGIPAEMIHLVPHQVFPVGEALHHRRPEVDTVLFFGALRPNKGIEVLPNLMHQLRGADVRLIVAGRGDSGLEAIVNDLAERDNRVRAEIGFATLERKRELFRQASVVVLPYTEFASQSGVLHDAYGHGRPVVVTDVGALGDTVREDGTGLVVPAHDSGALAGGICQALAEPNWSTYAAAARRVSEERSPVATGVRLRAVYDEVLGRGA